jgi:hypothetical protein
MYGGASKPESYCKITVYLQHNAPLLYENIQDLCLFGAFNTRGRNGVTFLLPGKKTQEKIDNLVGQDARKAVSMINACILPVYLENIEDFRSQQDDIPNKLGNKLPIKEITSSSVELSNGAKITRDSKFKRLHDTSPVAVYLLDGEVPTTGDESQAFNKKKGKNTEYSGGNDDFKELGGHRGQNGHSWDKMVEEAIAICLIRVGNTGIDHITHLGLSLINHLLSQVQGSDLHKLGMLLCKVHPVSPLYYLFCGCLLTDEERKQWVNSVKQYPKLSTLQKHLGMGLKQHAAVDSNFKKRENVMALQATNICTSLIKHASDIRDTYLSGEDFSRFGGADKFSEWIVLVSEFTFLFTKHYTRNVSGGNMVELKQIFDTYKRWVLNSCAAKNWMSALTLVNPKLDNVLMFSKERFCTILSLYVSHRFFPMGCDLQSLAKKSDGNNEGVVYGGSLAPNLIVPTCDDHITAKFWLKTIKD